MLDAPTRAAAAAPAAADLFAAAPSTSGSSSLSAAAFATPSPTTFGPASPAPDLMAHEAAHVVQQSAGASPYAGMF